MPASVGLNDLAVDIVGGSDASIFTDFATFYGQVSFGQVSYSGVDADHLLAKGRSAALRDRHVRLNVEGPFNRFSVGGAMPIFTRCPPTGNYRFSQYPITAFAGYRYDHGTLKSGGSTLGTL